jgi:hypothetical protein
MRSPSLALLALAVAVQLAECKKASGTLKLSSEDTEQYISKFAFAAGASGTVAGKLSHEGVYLDGHPHFLEFYLYDEASWAEYQKVLLAGSLCKDRTRLATHTVRIEASPDDETGKHVMQFVTPIQTPQEVTFYFAVIADCFLEEYDAHPPEIHYELDFVNGNMIFPGDDPSKARHSESELPAEEQGIYAMHLLLLPIMLAFAGYFATKAKKQFTQFGQVHMVVVLLGTAFILQMGSVFFELCHLHVFRSNGKGLRWRHSFFPADFLSELAQGLSELLLSFLLLTLACGWTLSAEDFGLAGNGGGTAATGMLAAFAKPAELTKKVTPASIFAVGLFVVQIGLELAGRSYEDNFNQFHDEDHLPGHLLQLLRVVLCVLFWAGLSSTMKSHTNKDIAVFLRQLLVFGTLWYLAFPVLVVYSNSFVAPANRHMVVTVGSITCQTVAIALLSVLFLGKSTYQKVSSLSKMGTIGSMSSLGPSNGKVCVD